jgi:cell division protein FtsL
MGYSNSSLAYNLEREEMEIRRAKKKKMQAVAARRAEKMKNVRKMVAVICVALMAFFMVSKYVAVYETQKEIESLAKQLSGAEAITKQKTHELEQSIDLKTVEEIATTRLGMQRPEKYQMVYLNVKQDDVAEVTADTVEGIRNRFINGAKGFAKNITGIFSLK